MTVMASPGVAVLEPNDNVIWPFGTGGTTVVVGEVDVFEVPDQYAVSATTKEEL
jgi:hypothetical protein